MLESLRAVLGDSAIFWIGTAVIVISTILDRLVTHYGEGSPTWFKWLRTVIDLIGVTPSKGHPWSAGLQLPLLSWSGPPKVYADKLKRLGAA